MADQKKEAESVKKKSFLSKSERETLRRVEEIEELKEKVAALGEKEIPLSEKKPQIDKLSKRLQRKQNKFKRRQDLFLGPLRARKDFERRDELEKQRHELGDKERKLIEKQQKRLGEGKRESSKIDEEMAKIKGKLERVKEEEKLRSDIGVRSSYVTKPGIRKKLPGTKIKPGELKQEKEPRRGMRPGNSRIKPKPM